MKKTILTLAVLAAAFLLVTATAGAQIRAGKFGAGVSGSYYLFQSDYAKQMASFGAGVDLSYHVLDNLSFRGAFGLGLLQAENDAPPTLSTTLIYANLGLAADLMPNSTVNPFIFVGANVINFTPRLGTGEPISIPNQKWYGVGAVGGVGVDIFPSEFFSITFGGEAYLPITDYLDGFEDGSTKDMYQRVYIGVKYYFFDQDFITKMLKTLESRYR